MTVLFDPADDYVRSVLDLAKVHGEISLADLEAICEAGIEARESVSTDDIADTIDALATMGIEVDNSLPPEEEARRDAAFLKSIREWPGPMPQLTGEGWQQLLRAIERGKATVNSLGLPERSSSGSASIAHQDLSQEMDELEPEIGSEPIDHFDEDTHLGDFITPVEETPAAYRRTFMQEMFASLGPRVRRTRPRIR
jgi:hypothetical protein